MSKTLTTEEIMERVAVGKPFTLLILLAGNPVPDDVNLVNQMQLETLRIFFKWKVKDRPAYSDRSAMMNSFMASSFLILPIKKIFTGGCQPIHM